jgi:hypothetical protein
VSLGIPFYLKKKKLGVGCELPGAEMQKTICAKIWARKNKNRSVSGFFAKIIYVQVMNFIPVKVSTLRESQIVVVFISVPSVTKIKIVIVHICISTGAP